MFIPVIYISCFVFFNFTSIFCYHWFFIVTTKDNLHTLRKGLASLIKKIENKEIIIKLTDKGPMIVIMSPDYHSNRCQSHISDTSYYTFIINNHPEN